MVQVDHKKHSESNKQKGESKKVSGEGKVVIKSGAYQTMLMHVLRFASSKIDPSRWVNVMGVCMGKIEGHDVVIYEAVPILHNARIEVAWESTDIALFTGLDEQYASKGLFACSWYHSHPGLQPFLSKVDVKNHLNWQNDANRRAVAIVFDHAYLENQGDLGFRAFRLNDFSKGTSSDWHEVDFVVEPPDKNTFFKIIKSIVEAGHKKDQSYVKELSEPERSESIEAGDEEVQRKEELQAIPVVSPLAPAIEGFQMGIQTLTNTFVKTLTSQLEEWTEDTKKATVKGADPLIEVMESMKEAVDGGMKHVQQQFEGSLNERVQALENSVTEVTKKFEQGPGNIAGTLTNFSKDVSQTLGTHLQAIFAEKLKAIEEIFSGALTKLGGFAALANNLTQALNGQSRKIKTLNTSVNDLVTGIWTKNEQSADRLRSSLDDSGKTLSELVDTLKKDQEKLKAIVKEIEAKIKDVKGSL